MSNILSVFTRRFESDSSLNDPECIKCRFLKPIVCFSFGSYLFFFDVFRDKKLGVFDLKKNPLWWRRSVKTFGFMSLIFGLTDFVLLTKDLKKKNVLN